MAATCPHCETTMKRQGKTKVTDLTHYYCPSCGQNWTKRKGERGYVKGQFRRRE